ncbi:hypothetical protein GCM10010252_19450 [Streptomyces aureoverticillatus]|nr:hypothetical protein GCM10010252_19450 [Streptomyces aureoverticillatus]
MTSKTTAPALPMPALEPVARPDCRVCHAAHRGRTAARVQQAAGRVRHYNEIIAAHPHTIDQGDDEGAKE